MELTKNHRQALLNELDKAQQDVEIQTACLKKQPPGDDMIEWFDMCLFLATKRVALIKHALIVNEIDY